LELYALSERAKLSILGLLLLIMLGFVAFTTVGTFKAVQSFQQQNSAVKAGDVNTVHPWMTIHVISRVYHVPEDYLYRALQIDSPASFRHVTLNGIANRKKQPVAQVIRTVQHAILAYRKEHPNFFTSTPTLRTNLGSHLPVPGRTRY
jgi:hypothetical protein